MSDTKRKPTRPRDLGRAGAKLWREIITSGKYELRPDEIRVLEDACRQADLIDAMEAELSRDLKAGLFKVAGSQGQPVINPLIAEVRQHRATLTSMLGKLKLPDESGAAPNQQRSAGNSRWASKAG